MTRAKTITIDAALLTSPMDGKCTPTPRTTSRTVKKNKKTITMDDLIALADEKV